MNEYSSPYFLHERVSQDELRTAYDAAKARGQDYLLWVMFTKVAEGPRVSGYSNVSVHEALLEAREGCVASDIQNFMDAHPKANLFMVMDLSREFEKAQRPKIRFPELKADFDRAQSAAQEKFQQARMDARPWWRKVLGLQPK